MKTSRRSFIEKSLLTAAGVAAGIKSIAAPSDKEVRGSGNMSCAME